MTDISELRNLKELKEEIDKKKCAFKKEIAPLTTEYESQTRKLISLAQSKINFIMSVIKEYYKAPAVWSTDYEDIFKEMGININEGYGRTYKINHIEHIYENAIDFSAGEYFDDEYAYTYITIPSKILNTKITEETVVTAIKSYKNKQKQKKQEEKEQRIMELKKELAKLEKDKEEKYPSF